MKKTLLAGSVIALALAVIPVAGVFADDSESVTATITVSSSCSIAREAYASGGTTANSSHKNGEGTWTIVDGNDTLSKTVSNGTVSYNLGSSQFKVICNMPGGYSVTVNTTPLTSGNLSIPNNNSFSSSVSGWAPLAGNTSSATKYTNNSVVNSGNTMTAGTTFEIYYGVGISSNQPAGTYTGTATYNLATI